MSIEMKPLYLLVPICLFLLSVQAFCAESAEDTEKQFSIGVGLDFTNGKYGSTTSTDSVSVPLILDWYPTDRLDAEFIVPFIYQSNAQNAKYTSVHRYGTMMGAVFSGAMGTPGPVSGNSPGSSVTSNPSSSESGIGDLSLSVGYVVVKEGDWVPKIRPVAYIKFPTADETKGLGTGEFDEGLGLTLSKWINDFHLTAEGMHIFQGKSNVYNSAAKDYETYDAGVGYQVTDDFLPSLHIRGNTPVADGAIADTEARLKFVYLLSDSWSLEGYAGRGFTNGSPDFAGGVSVYYDF